MLVKIKLEQTHQTQGQNSNTNLQKLIL